MTPWMSALRSQDPSIFPISGSSACNPDMAYQSLRSDVEAFSWLYKEHGLKPTEHKVATQYATLQDSMHSRILALRDVSKRTAELKGYSVKTLFEASVAASKTCHLVADREEAAQPETDPSQGDLDKFDPRSKDCDLSDGEDTMDQEEQFKTHEGPAQGKGTSTPALEMARSTHTSDIQTTVADIARFMSHLDGQVGDDSMQTKALHWVFVATAVILDQESESDQELGPGKKMLTSGSGNPAFSAEMSHRAFRAVEAELDELDELDEGAGNYTKDLGEAEGDAKGEKEDGDQGDESKT